MRCSPEHQIQQMISWLRTWSEENGYDAASRGMYNSVEMRKIGSLAVSVVGLGTNNFGMGMSAEEVPAVVEAALEEGINFFDTADSYGDSEERLGRALGSRRDDVVIATKFGSQVKGQPGTGGARPEYVRQALEESLRRLGTDRIDLYQLHRPDPQTPIGDTLDVLADLVHSGKVIEIGCSNFSAAQLQAANQAASPGARFVSLQNKCNLLEHDDEKEVLPTCQELGLSYLPYFPLASGLLTGKYKRGTGAPEGTRLQRWGMESALTDSTFDVIDALTAWAGDHGHSLIDLAFAWLAAKSPVASVIAGATKAEQVRANVAAGAWALTTSELAEIDALLTKVS